MNYIIPASFLLSFIYIFLGVHALNRNYNSKLNRMFFVISLGPVVLIVSYTCIFGTPVSESWAWFWFKASSLGWLTLSALCLHFALILTGWDQSIKKHLKVLLYLPAAALIILLYTVIMPAPNLDISKLTLAVFIHPAHNWFWLIFILYCTIYYVVMFAIVAAWGIASNFAREKRQALIMLSAGIIVVGSIVLNYFVFDELQRGPYLVMIVGLIWAVSILYAIIRFQFMDLNAVLQIKNIVNRVTDMVILVAPDGRIINVNDTTAKMLGYSETTLQQMPLNTIIPTEKQHRTAIANKDVFTMEITTDYKNARGEMIPTKTFWETIEDSLHEIAGILIIAQDLRLTRELEHEINEKNRIEKALRKSEEQFRDLFENANDLIYSHDPDGILLSANKAAEIMTGFQREEFIGLNILEFVVYEQRKMVIEMFTKKASDNLPIYYNVTMLNRQGERHDLEVSQRPIYDEGNIVAYQCITRDVTERTRMEEKLKFLSLHDSLTGLYNRAYFTEELHRLETGRFEPSGIIMCDLDDLKKVNDTNGHCAGDDMIIVAADLIKSCFRTNDVVARIGGDEFAIVVPNCNEELCKRLTKKIKCAANEYNLTHPQKIGISAGFAVRKDKNQTMDEVFKLADLAMYADKSRNKETGAEIVSAPEFLISQHSENRSQVTW